MRSGSFYRCGGSKYKAMTKKNSSSFGSTHWFGLQDKDGFIASLVDEKPGISFESV